MADTDHLRIFNIQKYSLHDGSGIRTVVFLKGCPLRCKWCSNPESQQEEPELIYRRTKCIGCDKCGLCKGKNGISFDTEGKAQVGFDSAGTDLEWTKICPTGALSIEGRYISIDELLEIVERDSFFYRGGNGGLTVSGGEPLMQENTVKFLRKAKERYLNTAIETCGAVDRERLLTAAQYLDQIFFDIKSVDDGKHRLYTGVTCKVIRENLKALYEAYPEKNITVRTPVIPGFNDTELELRAIENFLSRFPHIKWEKLKYHTYGVGKYEMLGRSYPLADMELRAAE